MSSFKKFCEGKVVKHELPIQKISNIQSLIDQLDEISLLKFVSFCMQEISYLLNGTPDQVISLLHDRIIALENKQPIADDELRNIRDYYIQLRQDINQISTDRRTLANLLTRSYTAASVTHFINAVITNDLDEHLLQALIYAANARSWDYKLWRSDNPEERSRIYGKFLTKVFHYAETLLSTNTEFIADKNKVNIETYRQELQTLSRKSPNSLTLEEIKFIMVFLNEFNDGSLIENLIEYFRNNETIKRFVKIYGSGKELEAIYNLVQKDFDSRYDLLKFLRAVLRNY